MTARMRTRPHPLGLITSCCERPFPYRGSGLELGSTAGKQIRVICAHPPTQLI
jgi:hypothetical protein